MKILFRCPVSCGDCYHDDIDCRGAFVNDALCAAFAHIRTKCAHTCASGPVVKAPVVDPIIAIAAPAVVPEPVIVKSAAIATNVAMKLPSVLAATVTEVPAVTTA